MDLLDERWDARRRTLAGRSAVVAGDPYVITVHVPEGWQMERVEAAGEKPEIVRRGEIATVRLVPSATKTVEWKMTFEREEHLPASP